jgi:SAM-dependent methyltransferase
VITGKSGASGHRAAYRVGTLLALTMLNLAPALAQESAEQQYKNELLKQQSIYSSKGKDVPDGYVTTRGLENYQELLPAAFPGTLKKLGSRDRWLDIGAGRGQAILDYYAPEYDMTPDGKLRTGGKAKAVAISIEDRRSAQWWQQVAVLGSDKIRYLHSKRLREYSREELGKFQIVTDVYGGFSYTDELSLFVERVLHLLEVGGSFFTMIASVHLEDGKDRPTTWYLTDLIDPAGRDVKVCTWLKSISCVQVTCESRSEWEAPTDLIHVKKVCNDVSVPPLRRLRYEAGNPPERHFQLTSPLPPTTQAAK